MTRLGHEKPEQTPNITEAKYRGITKRLCETEDGREFIRFICDISGFHTLNIDFNNPRRTDYAEGRRSLYLAVRHFLSPKDRQLIENYEEAGSNANKT